MKKLLRSTSLVAAWTLFSRTMGFIRDMVLASLFGATAGFDAFLVAFKIPNFARRLFAEDAFAQAFVPILSEYRELKTAEEAKAFIGKIAGTLGVVVLLVVALAEILVPLIIVIFAPGFREGTLRYHLASQMLHITFPYLLLISLTAFSGAVLNSYGRFGVPAFTPVLLNVSLIVAAIYGSPYFTHPIVAVAWGVILAGGAQLAFQIPFLYKNKLLPRPKISLRDEGVKKVLKLMVPAIFGVSVAQISALIDTVFASFLPVGSISWLYYSDRLTQFPLGLFGISIATVILPHLSRQHANKSLEEFSSGLDWAIRVVLMIGLPAALGLLLLAGPLLSTLFQHGAFDAQDVIMTRKSLMAYAIGLPAFMLVKVFATGFYSKQNIKTPVKIAVISLTTNILLNFVLIFPLKHAGLALSTSLASILNALLLAYLLVKYGIYRPASGWFVYSIRIFAANVIMAGMIIIFIPNLQYWMNQHWLGKVNYLLFWMGFSIVVYFISLWLVGVRVKHFKYST